MIMIMIMIMIKYKELESHNVFKVLSLHLLEVLRDWRRLHNEELHNLYSSPNIIRVII
jgi:hypothetical protein